MKNLTATYKKLDAETLATSRDAVACGDALSGVLQTAGTAALLAAVSGVIDPRVMAAQELASRGLSLTTGSWVGFDKAAEQCIALGFGDPRPVCKARSARLA